MTDQQLSLMHFVMRDELEKWKLVEFTFDNVAAIRSDGTTVMFDDRHNATDHIRIRAMEAALAHYHAVSAQMLTERSG